MGLRAARGRQDDLLSHKTGHCRGAERLRRHLVIAPRDAQHARAPVEISFARDNLSDTMYLTISFGESTPPRNLELDIKISNCKQKVDNFVRELTFSN